MRFHLKVFIVLTVLTGISFSAPVLDISPDPLKFGYISVGGSQLRDIVLSNTGDQTLVMDSCIFQAPFNVGQVAGLTIDPGNTVTITASFYPNAEIFYDDDLVFYSNASNSVYTLDVTANGVIAFIPGQMIWSFQHIENVVCVAVADDYNNDGIPEVVAEGYDAGASGDPLVCLSGSGSGNPQTVWSVHPQGGPSNSGGYGDQCLAYVSDLNGDGYGDIARGGAWGSRTIWAIDGLSGSTIWSYDTYANPPSGWVYSVAGINDLNNDGIDEVMAGVGSDADVIFCFSGSNGQIIWQYGADDAVSSITVLPDINADGLDEAVFAAMDNGEMIYCVSGASQGMGTPLWMFDQNNSTFSVCTIKDVNNDSYDDIISGTWGRGVIAFSGHRFGQGMILWENPVNNTYVMKVVSCPDLNGDDKEDVLVASWNNFAIALSGVDGSQIWSYFCGDDVWAMNYIDDVTGDGVADIIAGSFTHNVYLIDGSAGTLVWQFAAGAKPFSVRSISDVNGDGYNDVIAGTQMLGGLGGGEVFMISGGEVQTSVEKQPVVNIPENYLTVSNYPNPFNSSTVIKFELEHTENYTLTVYDINGRLVDQVYGAGQPGINSVEWNITGTREIVSGVYFYQVEAGNKSGGSKMLYLK